MQRAVVLLNEKGVAFDVTYIDLKNKPDWFLHLSPLGKVPALRVGETTLFESAAICEYLDEVHPPALHPAEPLLRAVNRGWFAAADELFGSMHRLSTATAATDYEQARQRVRDQLLRLEEPLPEAGPFFNGANFALVDATFAPAFMRIDLLNELQPMGLLEQLPKVRRWSEALLARESVTTSVVSDFADLLRDQLAAAGSVLARPH